MITSVEMINWRAYERREFRFEPGITFIMGANGTGKTSILEAIVYALTGQPSTVKDRGKLLRDPSRVAVVRLSFAVDGQVYLVERTQSRKRAQSARLTQEGKKKPLATSHRGVTARIERLIGVSADFLQRIVYMAEGDVFRFLSDPPGQALDLQIRRVLGLTQMDEFVQAVETAEKEIRGRIRTLRDLLGQLERLGVRLDTDLEQQMRDIDARQRELLYDLRSIQNTITEHRHEAENLLRLTPLLDRALSALHEDRPKVWQMSVLALFSELEQQTREVEFAIQQERVKSARLDGERLAHQRVLDILLPYANRAETLPCPVCSKPMTRGERESITRDVQSNIHRISEEMKDLEERQLGASSELKSFRREWEGLRELRNALAHVSFQTVSSDATLADLEEVILSGQAGFQAQLSKLQEQAAKLEQQMDQLNSEKTKYITVRNGLQDQECASPEEAAEALVDLEIRFLSLRAAKRAAQETLKVQRNIDMKVIYDQVARVWEVFRGKGGWRVELDVKGMPMLEDGQGRRFDLSQFSGGEKTVLLVMLHTIIAHHFSKCDFLLTDEPLEHLDAVNRRSLTGFLVDAYRQRSFQQALIATFEESLIRKYMSEEGVNIIHL